MGPWVGVVHGCIDLWMGVVHGCMGPWGGGGPWVHGWGECGTEDLEVPGSIPGGGTPFLSGFFLSSKSLLLVLSHNKVK